MSDPLSHCELGKKSRYEDSYTPKALIAIPRDLKRKNLPCIPPWHGEDVWWGYELSWLNPKGLPQQALLRMSYNAHSPNIIESKSMKLYLNSFNQTVFQNIATIKNILIQDVSEKICADVTIELWPANQPPDRNLVLPGKCLEQCFPDTTCHAYEVTPDLLSLDDSCETSEHTWHCHLLKSNCLVTAQPDWGSIVIHWEGIGITPESLLQYIVSYRQHQGFHEHCIERIFTDIYTRISPEHLTIYAHYTRRGGLDINPYRSLSPSSLPNTGIWRQ